MPNPSENSNFEQALKDIVTDTETRDYLQRLLGYALMKLGAFKNLDETIPSPIFQQSVQSKGLLMS